MRRILVLIIALSTLLTATAPTARADDPVQRAIAWLHTQQLADGSFSGVGLEGVTADVVYELALAGEEPGGPAWTKGGTSALAALAALTPGYIARNGGEGGLGVAGPAGKVARAVAAAGGKPRDFAGMDVISVIEKVYDPATGRYNATQLSHHTLAIEALLRAGEPIPTAAVDAMFTAQLPDGGWSWAFPDPTLPLPQPDVDSTGRVLQLLTGIPGVKTPEAYTRAARYLYASEVAGGWRPTKQSGTPNANSTALAIAGLRAAGYDPEATCFRRDGLGAVSTLLTYQEQSGAFVYIRQPGSEGNRLLATVDAMIGLLQPLAQPPAATSVCHPIYLPLVLR
jgi:hypothetical protein